MKTRLALEPVLVVLLAVASGGEEMKRLCEIAVPRKFPHGAPRPSDVCFSSRWKHPRDEKDPHDTFRAAAAFHATRLV